MELFDVAIVGGGPAGSVCAAFCSSTGLRTLLLEREKFPREKVCGDCLNPSCWSVLDRIDLSRRVRALPHVKLQAVEFVSLGGRNIVVTLPTDDDGEIAVKRSLFDHLLLERARELGACILEQETVTAVRRDHEWKIETSSGKILSARVLVGADGRNSTVARLCDLSPRLARDRIALQSHLPMPANFGQRVLLQFLPGGYSGIAPVNEEELNVCLVARPNDIDALKMWAAKRFTLPVNHTWRTITPLSRSALSPVGQNLFLIGDAARIVEPFTGEGIYYAMRSGELAAGAIAKMVQGRNGQSISEEFAHDYAGMYQGRLWINRLARASVLSPRLGSFLVQAARINPSLLRLVTGKIVNSKRGTTA